MISGKTVLYSGYKAEKEKLSQNLLNTLHKIKSFQGLENGWHFGEGRGPNQDTISLAKKIVSKLHLAFFCKVDAFPGIWGEIQVTAYPEGNFIEINILPNGSLELFIEDKNQNEILGSEGLDFETLFNKINLFKQQGLWKSFVYFPQNISTKIYPDSQVLPSGILLVQEEASPYLSEPAPSKNPQDPAAILTPITKRSALSPLYFGNSVQTNYQIILN